MKNRPGFCRGCWSCKTPCPRDKDMIDWLCPKCMNGYVRPIAESKYACNNTYGCTFVVSGDTKVSQLYEQYYGKQESND